MPLSLIIGIFLLVALIVASRFISENALKLLSENEKAKILDSFSNFRKYNQIPVLIIFALVLLIEYLEPEYSVKIFITLMILFIVFMVVSHLLITKKLNNLNLPRDYRKKYDISRIVYFSGFAICGATIIFNFI